MALKPTSSKSPAGPPPPPVASQLSKPNHGQISDIDLQLEESIKKNIMTVSNPCIKISSVESCQVVRLSLVPLTLCLEKQHSSPATLKLGRRGWGWPGRVQASPLDWPPGQVLEAHEQ